MQQNFCLYLIFYVGNFSSNYIGSFVDCVSLGKVGWWRLFQNVLDLPVPGNPLLRAQATRLPKGGGR